jgi:DNA repair protein RadD
VNAEIERARLGESAGANTLHPQYPTTNKPCPSCGSTDRRTAPGSGPHHQRLECAECSRWLKWLPLARNGLNLRQYQKEAVATVLDYLKSEQGSPCLDIPTGGGKSWVIAALVAYYQGSRVCVLQHRKELVHQNHEKLCAIGVNAGILSAGLDRYDVEATILVAGIQTACKRSLKPFDLLIIDEAHRIPFEGEGQYRTFIAANPGARVVGLTATPYRLDGGSVCGPHYILNKLCYRVTARELIELGFLSRLISKLPRAHLNTEGLHIRQGEYLQGEADARIAELDLQGALLEAINLCQGRRAILIFCPGRKTTERATRELDAMGSPTAKLYSGIAADERDSVIRDFKAGHYRALCNINILTEGFDYPGIDAVVMLRPTLSTALYQQMVGRGLRVAEGKDNCLILDFVGNIHQHGPADDPDIKGHIQVCESCRTVYAKVMDNCPGCSTPTPRLHLVQMGTHWTYQQERVFQNPQAAGEILTCTRRLTVLSWEFKLHRSRHSGQESLRVDYLAHDEEGRERFSEWVNFGHPNEWARKQAGLWWRLHTPKGETAPRTAAEAFTRLRHLKIRIPVVVRVAFGGKFPRIIHRRFPESAGGEP